MDDASESLKRALRHAFESPSHASVRQLYVISLAGRPATGYTVHRRGDQVLPKPSTLAIAQVGSDSGYYLLYLNDLGEEMTDTYHDDLDGAFGQAEAEFSVTETEWRKA